jgi:lipopolysaccharide exporter
MSDASPSDRPSSNLTRHTLEGLQWAYLGTAVGGVLQFGMTAVLARLLTPAAFGLVALAGLFLRFVDYFAKAGITQALIQKPTLNRADIRAAFTLSAGLSAAFAWVAIVAAPVAGRIAREPELVPVLRWLAIGLFLQGLAAPSVALLRRSLRFRELTLIEVGSYVTGYVGVGLTMAISGRGVEALVGAMLTQSVVNAVAAYLVVRHPLLPTTARASYWAILAFGSRISVVGFFEFLQSNLDTLAIGRWAGATQLGLYNRAKMLAELPSYQLMSGLSKVLFPSFSAIQLDQERLRKAYLSAVGAAAAIVLPMNAGMAVASREIVLVLLGPQWDDASKVLPWLLLASTVSLLGHFAGVVTEAQGALNAKILIAVASTCTLGMLLFFAEGRSLAAYGAAVSGAAAVSHLGLVLVLRRTLRTPLRGLLWPYARSSLAALLVAGAIAGCRAVLLQANAPLGLLLAAQVLTGAITLALMLRVGPLRVFRNDFAQRLANAGIIGPESGRLGRPLTWVVGPPTESSTWPR